MITPPIAVGPATPAAAPAATAAAGPDPRPAFLDLLAALDAAATAAEPSPGTAAAPAAPGTTVSAARHAETVPHDNSAADGSAAAQVAGTLAAQAVLPLPPAGAPSGSGQAPPVSPAVTATPASTPAAHAPAHAAPPTPLPATGPQPAEQAPSRQDAPGLAMSASVRPAPVHPRPEPAVEAPIIGRRPTATPVASAAPAPLRTLPGPVAPTDSTAVAGVAAGTPVTAAAQPAVTHAAPHVPQAYPAEAQPELADALTRLRSRGDGSHELSVQLHPAELGAVNVSATLHDGTLTVTVACASEAARAAVTAALPNLHAQLGSAGFGGVDVQFGGPPADRGHSGQPDQPPAHGGRERPDQEPERRQPRAGSDSALDRLL